MDTAKTAVKDDNSGFAARQALTHLRRSNNVTIPLNRYSFFEEVEDKLLVPMQLEINIQLQRDEELIYKSGGDNARVVVTGFLLWVPKLSSKDSLYDKYVSSFLKQKRWKYLREMCTESAPTQTQGFFQISSICKTYVKHT